MKPKTAIVPRATVKEKVAPDATIYLTKCGERVMIVNSKQFPNHPSDQPWMKEIREKGNNRKAVVRVSDGHELWGCKVEDLTPENK